VAGAAAVLEQARPGLAPRQVQRALTATATPVRSHGRRLGSWQVGYGHVNLDRAVTLVTAKRKWRKKLATAQRRADRRLARQDAYRVVRSDLWQEAAPAVTAMGSYAATHRVTVSKKASALKVVVVHPTTGQAGANLFSFTAVVKDARGRTVGRTTTDPLYSTGVAHALVRGLRPGTYTIEVVGDYAVSDPDTVDSDSVNGRVVFVQVAQLARR
jgi:serine protease AprX